MMDTFGVSSWDRGKVVPMRHRRLRSAGERSLHVGPVQGRARGARRWQGEQSQLPRCWRVPGPRVSRESEWWVLKWWIAAVGVKRGPIGHDGNMHLS